MSGRRTHVDWRFVDYIPEALEDGVVYIAPEFGAVMHLCLEGCGERVSTPLSPAQWSLTFDGDTISLWPSVGNWDLPCRSHYIVRRSKVVWAGDWSDGAIRAGAQRDRGAVDDYFAPDGPVPEPSESGFWAWLRGFFRLEKSESLDEHEGR